MAAERIVTVEAEQDAQDAYDWYEKQRLGLGEDFLSCLDVALEQICRSPESYAKVHEDYRRVMVRRFPYAIYYEFAGGNVVVYCIFHTSRDPAKWRARLP